MNRIFEVLMEKVTLNKILVTVAVFIAIMITGTTIAVLTKPKPVTVVRAQTQTPAEQKLASYKGLGKMRLVTAPEKNAKTGTTVVVNPLLSYTIDDEDFFEELSRKNTQIKSIFTQYFSSHTKSELRAKGEQRIKTELQKQLNEILTLNKIQDIYFEDFIFLE